MTQWATDNRMDRTERDDLILRYLPLANSLARRYRASGEPTDDLAQVACLGLVKAAERFDPDHGNSFAAFAGPTIIGELNRYLRDCTWPVHVERRLKLRSREIGSAARRISALVGRQPNLRELANDLDLEPEAVAEGLLAAAARETVSLDAPASDPDTERPPGIERVGGADPDLEQVVDVATVFAAARHLTRRARVILYLRFGEELSQDEIARRIGISQMHVSRIIRDSVARLRELTDESAAA